MEYIVWNKVYCNLFIQSSVKLRGFTLRPNYGIIVRGIRNDN